MSRIMPICISTYSLQFSRLCRVLPVVGGAVAEWVRVLDWRPDGPGSENFSLRNFGNSVYPALPVSFGGDTKSRRSLLSGVYAQAQGK